MKKLTYKKSGVDIDKANIFLEQIKPLIKKVQAGSAVTQIGGFAGLFRFDKAQYKDPILVSSCDGVGTKLKIAIQVNRHDMLGYDLVGMNVNDILCIGAKPLFFLDYIACGKLKPDVLTDVVKGIVLGCLEARCVLIGGETAEMPGMYRGDDYDLAGFCLGVVDKGEVIDGSKIEPGDRVIGLESNGLHSNGFSLVRKVFSKNELKRLSNELLRPTRIYVKPVLSLLRENAVFGRHPAKGGSWQPPSDGTLPKAVAGSRLRTAPCQRRWRATIKGIAHITGGAFYDKISRILPKNVNVRIDKSSWVVPKIFRLIQNKGNIADKEMYRTFNMGIGMVLVVDSSNTKKITENLLKLRLKSWVIGKVVKGKKEVDIV